MAENRAAGLHAVRTESPPLREHETRPTAADDERIGPPPVVSGLPSLGRSWLGSLVAAPADSAGLESANSSEFPLLADVAKSTDSGLLCTKTPLTRGCAYTHRSRSNQPTLFHVRATRGRRPAGGGGGEGGVSCTLG